MLSQLGQQERTKRGSIQSKANAALCALGPSIVFQPDLNVLANQGELTAAIDWFFVVKLKVLPVGQCLAEQLNSSRLVLEIGVANLAIAFPELDREPIILQDDYATRA